MPSLPSSADERDYQFAKKIVDLFDKEYGTKVHAEPVRSLKNMRLDFLVKYLWKVFGYSFYTGIRCDDEHSLALRSFRYERVGSLEEE